jgi:hypothetical protein
VDAVELPPDPSTGHHESESRVGRAWSKISADWPETIDCGHAEVALPMAGKHAFRRAKSQRVFGQSKIARMFREGSVCARVYARPADAVIVDARYARPCRQARLDDRN